MKVTTFRTRQLENNFDGRMTAGSDRHSVVRANQGSNKESDSDSNKKDGKRNTARKSSIFQRRASKVQVSMQNFCYKVICF